MFTNLNDLGNAICIWLGLIGGFVASLIGGFDGVIQALLVFMAVDFISGVLCGAKNKELSSKIGAEGIKKKIMIVLLIVLGAVADKQIGTSAIRNTFAFFYIGNEFISIAENAGKLNLPIPKKVVDILVQLKKGNDEPNTQNEQIK